MNASALAGVEQSAGRRLAVATLIATLTFNAVLCFVNTRVAQVSDTVVIGAEEILVVTALALGLGRDAKPYIVLGIFLSYAALLMALRPLLDLKAVRDFVIPIAFYLLGRRWGDPRMADRVALLGGLIVLIFGVFEATALDTYVDFFNIAKYYVARDSAATGVAVQTGSGPQTSALFTSGFRWDARTILPFLGPHRSSSVFLEPVSMGNFGAILYLWSLYRKDMTGRWLTMVIGLGAIVLADARFGLYVCILGTAAFAAAPRILPPWWFSLPFVIMSGFAIYGFTSPEVDWTNDFAGRMLWTARLITSLSDGAVWGLSVEKPFLADSGYAYSLNQIGLVGVFGLWALFIFMPLQSEGAWRFKCCAATYICLLLVISGSVYSIKTAALLWFMLGSSDGFEAPVATFRRLRS